MMPKQEQITFEPMVWESETRPGERHTDTDVIVVLPVAEALSDGKAAMAHAERLALAFEQYGTLEEARPRTEVLERSILGGHQADGEAWFRIVIRQER